MLPRSPLVEDEDVSPRRWLSILPSQQRRIASGTLAQCPVRTYHASWMKSSTSDRTPPPTACGYPGHTRTRNLCNFCRTYIHTRTRNFCKLCTTFKPVPGTSGSSVRQCHKQPGYGYSIFIPAWKFCNFMTPVPKYPELLEAL